MIFFKSRRIKELEGNLDFLKKEVGGIFIATRQSQRDIDHNNMKIDELRQQAGCGVSHKTLPMVVFNPKCFDDSPIAKAPIEVCDACCKLLNTFPDKDEARKRESVILRERAEDIDPVNKPREEFGGIYSE